MNKPSFEQLIEYVINDEEAKARELFHQIVVEKSRTIYESLMDEDEQIDEDDAMGRTDRYDEAMGGDQADDLIDDVEAEEQGMQEAEDDEMDMEVDMDADGDDAVDMDMEVGGDEDLEDRVVDLEDKLDELMAEFESMMGGDDMGSEMGDEMDSPDMTGMEVVDDEMETEGMGMGMAPIPMEEAVSLKAVPAPKHGDNGANSKSPVAFNSGAKGMAASPVKMTGDTAQGRPAPTTKDLIGKVGNSPAQGTQDPKPATKPHLAQATGVNTKSPLPKQ
jgi:hypothetical protein